MWFLLRYVSSGYTIFKLNIKWKLDRWLFSVHGLTQDYKQIYYNIKLPILRARFITLFLKSNDGCSCRYFHEIRWFLIISGSGYIKLVCQISRLFLFMSHRSYRLCICVVMTYGMNLHRMPRMCDVDISA